MPVVWLIEDNAAFRRATERLLRTHPEVTALAAFERCEPALAALQAGQRPDIVLLDVGLPGIDGITGIRQLKSLAPEASILVLTVFEDDEKIFRAICAGASGYLLKAEPTQNLLEAIDQAMTGGAPMNPRVARRVLEMFARASAASPDYHLNEREHTVLELMVQGCLRKQIADRLALNAHTVDYVMRCIYRKLHVNCLAAAVSIAVRDRLVTPPAPRAALRKP